MVDILIGSFLRVPIEVLTEVENFFVGEENISCPFADDTIFFYLRRKGVFVILNLILQVFQSICLKIKMKLCSGLARQLA